MFNRNTTKKIIATLIFLNIKNYSGETELFEEI